MAPVAENSSANVDSNINPTTPLEEKLNGLALKDPALEKTSETPEQAPMEEAQKEVAVAEEKDGEIAAEVEPKTRISFPVKLADGKQLMSVGLRKKSVLGMGIKIYTFGLYSDSQKLKENLKAKIAKQASKEMYQAVIDDDSAMTVRLVIVFSGLTMNMVKKSFDEGLGSSIKKLTGGKKNDELVNEVMGVASDGIKLTSGSIIEISRLPGFVLQTKVMDEVISKVESELLCRAYVNMYLGDDPFDKDAKDKFGISLLSLF